MLVKQFFPVNHDRNISDLIDELTILIRKEPIRPFDPLVVDFFSELSSYLLQHSLARSFPDVIALAYWMRKSRLRSMEQWFNRMRLENIFLVPHGLVFHVPPSNVDTIYVYLWVIASLTGNRSLIRLPSFRSSTVSFLLECINKIINSKTYERLYGLLFCIGYDHNNEITSFISNHCDLRLLWGGNNTVSEFRKVPTSPYARDLVFPDRFSFSVIGSTEYLNAPDSSKSSLTEAFFKDVYSFDQMACSSPRLVVWIGSDQFFSLASQEFFDRLYHFIQDNGYNIDVGSALNKIDASYKFTLDLPVLNVNNWGNIITVLTLSTFFNVRDYHLGAGFFLPISLL